MLFYPAALPLSRQTLTYVTGVIRRHRAQIGSPWRKLPSCQLRDGRRPCACVCGRCSRWTVVHEHSAVLVALVLAELAR
jgi:hypothetical protein